MTTSTPSTAVPFSVSEVDFVAAVRAHLMTGDNTPDNLVRDATVTNVVRRYFPVWFYEGTFNVAWTALFGKEHREPHHEWRYDYRTKKQERVLVYRTRVDWTAANGQAVGSFSLPALAADYPALTGLPGGQALVIGAAAGETVSFERAAQEGCTVMPESADSTSRDVLAQQAMHKAVEEAVYAKAQQDQQKSWNWTYTPAWTVRTRAAPVFEATVTFEGKAYRVFGSGTSAKAVVADALPVDKRKVAMQRLGAVPPLATAVAMWLSVSQFHGSFGMGLAALSLAMAYFYIRTRVLAANSRAKRQLMLAEWASKQTSPGLAPATALPSFRPSVLTRPSVDRTLLGLVGVLCTGLAFIGVAPASSDDGPRARVAAPRVVESVADVVPAAVSAPVSAPVPAVVPAIAQSATLKAR